MEAGVAAEEVYASLCPKLSELGEEGVCTPVECDEGLAEELGLNLKEVIASTVESEKVSHKCKVRASSQNDMIFRFTVTNNSNRNI